MECRQSDGRIVPEKAGNAARGKPKGDCSSQSFHAKQYQRGNINHTQGWSTNGNEIGENIPTIAGKTRHGIYINRASDKQGNAKEVPRRNG